MEINKIVEDVIYDLTYIDILKLPLEIRKDFLSKFNDLLYDISKEIYSHTKTVGQMLYELEYYKNSSLSNYLFPGKEVKYYPQIIHRKSLNSFTCPIDGARYSKGSECAIFKPFIYLPIEKESYVLKKPIKTNINNAYIFPTTFSAFEEFIIALETSYERDDEEMYNIYNNFDSLSLRKLKSKR